MNIACKLVNDINAVLDNRQLRIEIANTGKALRLTGRGKAVECDAWIRIEKYADNVIFNVNNVYLSEDMRKKGILTKICKAAIDSGVITELWVTSIISDEMHAWCRKRNMIEDKQKMKYTYKLK